MKHGFSSAAIDLFGDVMKVQDFVMTGAHDVRLAEKADSRDARITAIADYDYRNGTKYVTVRNCNGSTLYRGSFELF